MQSIFKFSALVLVSLISLTSTAYAGDGATLLFREGQLAYVANGYSALVEEYKKLNRNDSKHNIIELKIESSPFLINLAEVVIICRDRCTSLEVMDPRRSAQHKGN